MGYGYRRGANLRRVVALVGMRTSSESPSGGDDGSPETQRTPGPVPGCNRPGACDAEETVAVVRSHRDGTGTAVGTPWSEPECMLGGSGRAQVHRRRGTRQSHGRTISCPAGIRRRILLGFRGQLGVRRVEGEEGVKRSLDSVHESRDALFGSV
jgi:hypothetical protein